MHKLYKLVIFTSLLLTIFISNNSDAISQNLLISQVKVGDSTTSRLIEMYNNSDSPYEVSGLCIYYSTPKNAIPYVSVGCFNDPNPAVHMFVRARSFLLAASIQTGIPADMILVPGLGTGASGHVYLMDKLGKEIDRVGWGEAINAEGLSPVPIDSTRVIERRKDEVTGALIDTDNNQNDFINSSLRQKYQYGALYDVIDVCKNIEGIQETVPTDFTVDGNGGCNPPPVDICSNIDGMQVTVPSGYAANLNGECQIDSCQNIDGLQQTIPDGMELNNAGNCIVHDECSNIPDIQTKLPDGYEVDSSGNCNPIPVDVCNNLDGVQQGLPEGMEFDVNGGCVVIVDKCSNLDDFQTVVPNGFLKGDNDICSLGLLPLQITELLPNAVGSDDGNEFIELYNPNKTDINLSSYIFYVGGNYTHAYSFPIGSYIKTGEYKAFLNDGIKFTLVNTTSSVHLFGIDNLLIDETQIYNDPPDGMAWALIDNTWQYTNQPTPNEANKVSLVEPEPIIKEENNDPGTVSNLMPCASNQYRSPETNRCRLIVAVSSSLTPCKDGQYRSEETNRCRSIASDVADLTACAEGQERNPETNRCRSITAVLGASDLKPCEEGQERNPETNRCRNIVSAIPVADYAPEQTFEQSNNYILWWSLAGVGAVAIIYGIWEWRQEIVKLVQKIGLLVRRK